MGHGLLGIVFLAEEAPVYEALHPQAQGIEEGRDGQCGDPNHQRVLLSRQIVHKILEQDDAAKINQRQERGQEGILQRAPNNDVDVVEALARDGERNGRGDCQNAEDKQDFPELEHAAEIGPV